MYYRNTIHQKIFEEQIHRNPCKCPNEYLAALYLLTADKEVWDASRSGIDRKVIDFTKIRHKDFTTYRYAVFIIAKDIYICETHITLKELCDSYLIPDRLFKLIITAIYIGRFGYPYIGIEKAFNSVEEK